VTATSWCGIVPFVPVVVKSRTNGIVSEPSTIDDEIFETVLLVFCRSDFVEMTSSGILVAPLRTMGHRVSPKLERGAVPPRSSSQSVEPSAEDYGHNPWCGVVEPTQPGVTTFIVFGIFRNVSNYATF